MKLSTKFWLIIITVNIVIGDYIAITSFDSFNDESVDTLEIIKLMYCEICLMTTAIFIGVGTAHLIGKFNDFLNRF